MIVQSASFLSMGYTTEDIIERITYDNGNGTITVAVETGL